MVEVEVVVEVVVGVGVGVVVGVEVGVVVGVVVVVVVEVEVGVGGEGALKRKGNNMKRTIEVSEETYQAIKDHLGGEKVIDVDSLDDLVGNCFFFRTVTYHLVGRVKKVIGGILELEGCSWVADSGRFMQAIKEGELDEVEPLGQGFVNLATVTDFFPWNHDLPETQL